MGWKADVLENDVNTITYQRSAFKREQFTRVESTAGVWTKIVLEEFVERYNHQSCVAFVGLPEL